jgi:signal peptidase II
LPLAVAAVIVALDRLTKDAIVQAIGPAASIHRIDLLGHWVALDYAENRGVAFGLFGGLSAILPVVAIAILLAIGLAYVRQTQPPLLLGLAVGLAVGGAVGNLIDRVRLGHVIDFIAIGPWPNFNVADSAVTVGVVGFIAWMLWLGRDASHAPQAEREAAPLGKGMSGR